MNNEQFEIEQALRTQASAAGVIDQDALQFVDRSKVHYLAADNIVAGAKEAIQALAAKHPNFFAAKTEQASQPVNLREIGVKPGSPEHKAAQAAFRAKWQDTQPTSQAPTINLREAGVLPGSKEHRAATQAFLSRY